MHPASRPTEAPMTARDRITSLVSFELEQKFILFPFTYSECFRTGLSAVAGFPGLHPNGLPQYAGFFCEPNLTPAQRRQPCLVSHIEGES